MRLARHAARHGALAGGADGAAVHAYGGAPHVMASTIHAASPWAGPLVVVAYFRDAADAGFSARDRWKSSLLLPHLAHALAESARASDAERRRADAEAALNGLRHGILLMGVQGEVLFHNRAAARIFELNDGLRLQPSTRASGRAYLAARLSTAQAAIDEAVRRAAAGPGTLPHPGTVAIPRPSGRAIFRLRFSPLPSRHGFSDIAHGAARVIISIADTAIPAEVDPGLMKSLYGLTRAEVAVAQQVIEGKGLEEIGECCGLSVNTLKTHLNHIYAKTNTANRAMLVRLLVTLDQAP